MTLPEKIARLVAERGWNQETFARQAGLNRITVRHIIHRTDKRLRNQTVRRCADALGLPVHELVHEPLEKLIPRVRAHGDAAGEIDGRLKVIAAMQPELKAWMDRHPDRAAQFSRDEIDELASLQGTGGPLTQFGVEHFVKLIERRRALHRKLHAIAGTEYLDLVEQLLGLVYEKIHPYRERK